MVEDMVARLSGRRQKPDLCRCIYSGMPLPIMGGGELSMPATARALAANVKLSPSFPFRLDLGRQTRDYLILAQPARPPVLDCCCGIVLHRPMSFIYRTDPLDCPFPLAARWGFADRCGRRKRCVSAAILQRGTLARELKYGSPGGLSIQIYKVDQAGRNMLSGLSCPH